jgi:hypothetical protein
VSEGQKGGVKGRSANEKKKRKKKDKQAGCSIVPCIHEQKMQCVQIQER